jgi:hypothetical protein
MKVLLAVLVAAQMVLQEEMALMLAVVVGLSLLAGLQCRVLDLLCRAAPLVLKVTAVVAVAVAVVILGAALVPTITPDLLGAAVLDISTRRLLHLQR